MKSIMRSVVQQQLQARPSTPVLHRPQLQSRQTRRSRLVCNAEETKRATPKRQMLVYVPPHPLVKHWVAVLRNKHTPDVIFRSACAELGRILIYEAAREWLPTQDAQVETPCGVADVTVVDINRPIMVVPVLRAGLVLLEQAATVLPATRTFHVGYVRDEETLEARCYLNKLPAKLSEEDLVLVSDPMLATGGTISQVLKDIIDRGAAAENIRLVSVVCASPALKLLSEQFPGLKIYTGMIDAELNEKGYIVPGLGDAGDRAFGTGS